MQQALTNLVMNAIHASPRGGVVEVSLRSVEELPPPHHGGARAEHWCLEVRDQGPGIPEDQRQVIFEPFFTTKDVGEGTGLGLTVVHGIVTEHDGWITIDDAPGGGSVFCVHLPVAEREEAMA
jgi:signal transduction histidine kinase